MSRSEEFIGGKNPGLSDDDVRMLGTESQQWRYAGDKENHIRNEYGISGTRYYQKINQLMDNPAAVSHNNGQFAPLINRLRRVRDEKRDARSAKRLRP